MAYKHHGFWQCMDILENRNFKWPVEEKASLEVKKMEKI